MHYYDFELCPALRSTGVDVTLFTCDETENLNPPPSLPVRYPFQGIYGNTSKVVRGLRYLRGLVKIGLAMHRQGANLAHFHYFHFPPLDYLYLKWLQIAGKHIVLTAHDVVPFDARPSDLGWLRRIYHTADRIIVHAESNRDTLAAQFQINPDKVYVIPMGPYLRFAHEQAMPAELAKERLGLKPDTPVVLFFGQIKKVKGLQYLIHAFQQVADQYSTARLVIAGPEWKTSFADYAALIRELNLVPQVLTHITYVPDEQVGTFFSAADVVALPYTESYQSAVLYMAYSFARPVVASAVGGLTEVIEDGVTGLLVPPADVKQLAKALLVLLKDTVMAQAMGKQGRALVESRFGWAEIARKIVAVYSEAVQ